MTIVSDPSRCALARQEIAALAIANARRVRAGQRPSAMLEALPPGARAGVLDDAEAALTALRKAGIRV